MSRQTKIGQLVKQGMQGADYSEQDEDDLELSKDEWQMVDSIMDMFNLTQTDAIKCLEKDHFDFDKTVQKIQRNRQKQKEKEEKKVREKEKEKEERLLLEKQKEIERQAKIESKSSKVPDSPSKPRRKSSQEEPIRKNSHSVEDYAVDHYNTQYPSLGKSRESPSNTISIVVVGHVDSGKSTLLGVLMKDAAYLDRKEVHRNAKGAKEAGKESFKDAWVTDSTEEERARGVTIDVGVRKIALKNKNIVFLDSPGHRDFIPNMITGAAQADYAILVVDVDNFEGSFDGGGQTKEHAYIVRSLGVHKLIVAINKMDRINWEEQRYAFIHNRLSTYLFRIGFKEEQVEFLPISAVQGLFLTYKNMRPFSLGPHKYTKSLFDIISDLPVPPRPIDRPFRMTITNVYEPQYGRLKGHCISGKVEGGIIEQHNKLVILPLDTQCLVKDMVVNEQKVKQASVGDSVDLQIKLLEETAFEAIKTGMVLSSLQYSVPVSTKIVVEALALDLQLPVLRGTQVVVYVATSRCPARITRINFIFNPSDGTILKKNPKSIRSHDCAEIQLQFTEKMCVELFSNYKVFGRVIIREKKQTLFVGTIKKIK